MSNIEPVAVGNGVLMPMEQYTTSSMICAWGNCSNRALPNNRYCCAACEVVDEVFKAAVSPASTR